MDFTKTYYFSSGRGLTKYYKSWGLMGSQNETPRGKQRGIKIPTAQDKSRSKLRGTNPERD
jgi:hypothetical protein